MKFLKISQNPLKLSCNDQNLFNVIKPSIADGLNKQQSFVLWIMDRTKRSHKLIYKTILRVKSLFTRKRKKH